MASPDSVAYFFLRSCFAVVDTRMPHLSADSLLHPQQPDARDGPHRNLLCSQLPLRTSPSLVPMQDHVLVWHR